MTRLILLILVFFTNIINAQTGIGTALPHTSSALEINVPNKGVLFSRIALTGTTDVITIPSPAHSLTIYNTVTTNDISPGYYYWNTENSKWTRLLDSSNLGWSKTGNAGTDPSINFIGTTDDKNLVFKRNNVKVGEISFENLSFGTHSFLNNVSGINNTAIGGSTLSYNVTGSDNTAVGYYALLRNTMGNNNIALGEKSLGYNTKGNYNIAIGSQSSIDLNIEEHLDGFNTIIGSKTGGGIINGKNNTILGSNVTNLSPTLSNNIIIADGSGNRRINVDERGNVGIGTTTPNESAALEITSPLHNKGLLIPKVSLKATNNVAPLTNAPAGMTVYNTAKGGIAPYNVSPGQYYFNGNEWITGWNLSGNRGTIAGSNFIGTIDNVDLVFKRYNSEAGRLSHSNTSFGLSTLLNSTGLNNTAVGQGALENSTSGKHNTAVGVSTLNKNTNGSLNSAYGYLALSKNSLGNYNVAIGNQALWNSIDGSLNVAIGYNALGALQMNSFNTVLGSYALASNTTGASNVAIGYRAGYNYNVTDNSVGHNTIIGYASGEGLVTGNKNTIIGANISGLPTNLSNAIVLGEGATLATSNAIKLGNTSISNIFAQVGISETSDRRFKEDIKTITLGLKFVNNLHPVEYIRKNNKDKTKEWGVIAQELQQAINNADYKNAGIIQEDGTEFKILSVRYTDLIAPIIKALQELSEQNCQIIKKIIEMEADNQKLKQKIAEIELKK